MNDQVVIDRIATLLGTSEEWSGADMLESIANLISDVRPHPGNCEAGAYQELFRAATGRECPTECVESM